MMENSEKIGNLQMIQVLSFRTFIHKAPFS
jgi:hypothetical protein